MGSAMKTAEMMLGRAAVVGASEGGSGGAPPACGRPQLNRPPAPERLTAPPGHELTGDTAPELAQSYVVPAVPWNWMLPSIASHGVGAASTICAANTADAHASAPATAAGR